MSDENRGIYEKYEVRRLSDKVKIRLLFGLLMFSSALGIIRAPMERRAGRAEMKRWQDDYYQRNPLLPPGKPITFVEGLTFYLQEGWSIDLSCLAFNVYDKTIKANVKNCSVTKPLEIKQGWYYENIIVDPATRTIKGNCPGAKPSDCQYPSGCVTISMKTYWESIEQLRDDRKELDKAAKVIRELTKEVNQSFQ